MTREPEDLEIGTQVKQAFPAPAPDEVDRTWERLATTPRTGVAWMGSLARAAVAAVVVAAAFTAGYAAGRSSGEPARAVGGEPSSPPDADPLFTIRPPELLPATVVGGAS
jgi:hypothetical protein